MHRYPIEAICDAIANSEGRFTEITQWIVSALLFGGARRALRLISRSFRPRPFR